MRRGSLTHVTVPVGHVFVGDARGDIEHDDRALSLDVVPVPQAAELLLPGRVPHVEHQLAAVGVELERVHLDAERRNVLLLELAGLKAASQGVAGRRVSMTVGRGSCATWQVLCQLLREGGLCRVVEGRCLGAHQVTLHEGGLADATVADEHELERRLLSHCGGETQHREARE